MPGCQGNASARGRAGWGRRCVPCRISPRFSKLHGDSSWGRGCPSSSVIGWAGPETRKPWEVRPSVVRPSLRRAPQPSLGTPGSSRASRPHRYGMGWDGLATSMATRTPGGHPAPPRPPAGKIKITPRNNQSSERIRARSPTSPHRQARSEQDILLAARTAECKLDSVRCGSLRDWGTRGPRLHRTDCTDFAHRPTPSLHVRKKAHAARVGCARTRREAGQQQA